MACAGAPCKLLRGTVMMMMMMMILNPVVEPMGPYALGLQKASSSRPSEEAVERPSSDLQAEDGMLLFIIIGGILILVIIMIVVTIIRVR